MTESAQWADWVKRMLDTPKDTNQVNVFRGLLQELAFLGRDGKNTYTHILWIRGGGDPLIWFFLDFFKKLLL